LPLYTLPHRLRAPAIGYGGLATAEDCAVVLEQTKETISGDSFRSRDLKETTMWGLVAGPVLICLIILGAVFVCTAPMFTLWAKAIWRQIKQTLSEMRETWRMDP